ncbi:MAG TPA: hypothetical protein VIM51_12185 [Desulfosporosinus sp.]
MANTTVKKAKASKKVLTVNVIEMNQPSKAACVAFNVWINEFAKSKLAAKAS